MKKPRWNVACRPFGAKKSTAAVAGLQAPYSAAVAGASVEPLVGAAPPVLLFTVRAPELRAPDELFDSTKSEMRGTISERKREPLNTP